MTCGLHSARPRVVRDYGACVSSLATKSTPAVGLQRKSGQDRHAYAGGDEGLHDDHVVAGGSEVLARAVAPALLAQPGVGPVTGAHVLISWSHPGRLGAEAAFVMLAGAAPIEASSGRVVRHRLNRGRDRQLNRALHCTPS